MSSEIDNISSLSGDEYSSTVFHASLADAVESSISQMPWLTNADDATIALARTYATRIDQAVSTGEGQEVTKALYLGPHLLNTMRALGGTPEARGALETDKGASSAASKLSEYRDRAKSRTKGA